VAKPQYELWAEVLRDVGILFFVFAPLDTMFRAGRGATSDWILAGGVALGGLLLIWLGIKMESRK
jgi:hypothetical protein